MAALASQRTLCRPGSAPAFPRTCVGQRRSQPGRSLARGAPRALGRQQPGAWRRLRRGAQQALQRIQKGTVAAVGVTAQSEAERRARAVKRPQPNDGGESAQRTSPALLWGRRRRPQPRLRPRPSGRGRSGKVRHAGKGKVWGEPTSARTGRPSPATGAHLGRLEQALANAEQMLVVHGVEQRPRLHLQRGSGWEEM